MNLAISQNIVNQSPYQANLTIQQHPVKIAAIHALNVFIIIGLSIIPFLPNLNISNNVTNSIFASVITYLLACYSLIKLSRYPGSKTLLNLPSIMVSLIGFTAIIFTSFRLDYSRTVFTLSGVLIPILVILQHKILSDKKTGKYLVLPFGCFHKLVEDRSNKYLLLPTPGLGQYQPEGINGIIFDQHQNYPEHWQQFLAQSASMDIPLFDTNQVYESLFGKSPLDHLPEPTGSSLKPHWMYRSLKRTLESFAILTSSPLWLPLIFIFAIAIKIESKGPAFFIQKRTGRGGKEFNMVKLRSMCQDSEVNGAQFAGEDDPRITRIGRFIRKVRIDEIPQFFNVLKGDMALIGPRPEQKQFVEEFEAKIPLYTLRHVVKPGITGWAQVTHGYADDEESTKEKLAHDFYYVKNLSLWLDIMVIVKTIKTMINGFGAR